MVTIGKIKPHSKKRTAKEYVLLTVCAAGFLSFTPFTLYRLICQEWLLATIDSLLVITMFSGGVLVWLKRKVRLACILLSFFCVSGMIAVIYTKGPSLIYWAYPTLATAFFLMKQREAVIIDILAITALAPAMVSSVSKVEFASILTTMLLVVIFAYIFAVQTRKQRQQLALLATEDPLTGVGNRRAFNLKFDEVLAANRRNNQPVSLLILDLDYFKSINDTYGHEIGDQILCQITNIIRKRIRGTDSLYRIGGEEFVVIAMGTNLAGGWRLAEQLRLLVAKSALLSDKQVTISLGLTQLKEGDIAAECLQRADSALYEAKRSGRNTIRTAR